MFRRPLLALTLACLPLAAPLTAVAAEDPAALASALEAANKGDWPVAMGRARTAGPVASDILEWMRLRAGGAETVLPDYMTFLGRHPDWPGMELLQRRGEASIPENDNPATVVAYFHGNPPQTGRGALRLAEALAATGNAAAADKEAIRAWRGLSLSAPEQAEFLDRFARTLEPHHGGRMAAMLDEGDLDDARRMLPLVTQGTRAVAEARIALQAHEAGVDAKIAAVPDYMAGSAGLAYDRFRWRIWKDLYDGARDLLLERSDSAESLGDPQKWAEWRAILARREMRLGHPELAYRIAATHHLDRGSDYADLEWLSGYIALRRLNDPERALAHFGRFQSAVSSPISLGRAGYWQGRAFEAMGRPEAARQAYAFGANYQTSFYGLLSAEKLSQALDPVLTGKDLPPSWDGAGFTRSPIFQAAELLYAAGADDLGERFLLHLGESLTNDDLARLARYAIDRDRPHLALMVAKAGAARGLVWPAAYFPMNGLEKLSLPVEPELALAIARRESEFDPKVISHAGARGLMQLMPGTAKLMATKTGQAYDLGRLTADWAYNASLGSAYLAQLIEEFGDAPALVAAGYNAGPGRPRQWVQDFGDPRQPGTDVVDWIESIPFVETQNYVMRVAETLPVYRARLRGETGPVRLTDELVGR
ncbi:lytic transglycosylase domain-containing protein [Frigidibacter sp. MR17.14]|uniref:lytic transglycosylase domain-containing protein n=1 Tax=Frigidibacter sp. MR17.14 TaxID=3126509 RepID=UPI003013160D